MDTVALDTNVVSQILHGRYSDIEERLDRIKVYYIPWIVYGELLAGVKAGSNPVKYTPVLEAFLSKPYVLKSSIAAVNTVPFYAEIYRQLRRQGTPISPNDLWIAAECACLGLPLFSLDEGFLNVKQILRFV